MVLFKEASPLTAYLDKQKQAGKPIGFVPTMGALHNGHISLIQLAKTNNALVVCSIFVNPTQFNDPKDFEKYPVTIGNDILLLERSGCDVLFVPSVHEIYPGGTNNAKHYDLGSIENVLEGKHRPGHFQGVCQVVDKLLHIVLPHRLFLGQKDYQQVIVLRRLTQLLSMKVEIITGETQREANGLAMSSRNLRLTDEQRNQASAIYKMLQHIKTNIATTPARQLEQYASDHLLHSGFSKVDYVCIADADTLQPYNQLSTKAVALIAAFIGDVRLIDNLVL